MRKIIFLLLLPMSSMSICQSTNTNLTKCFPIAVVNELYNGVKQGENLKLVLEKTEKTLTESKALNLEQKNLIQKQNDLISGKDEIIANNLFIADQQKIANEAEVSSLKAENKILQLQSKKEARKKLWTGIKIGGISVAIIGAAGLILLNN
ncbi:hypothetical protein ACFQO9_04565 [Chryseobacterium zhengzhouense]|uniref:Uncharacterized protein n=1 Tax=Chryseobacterium zhengzhouense TaxID=1636086 RepID=A0ABW2LY20_9FLAO